MNETTSDLYEEEGASGYIFILPTIVIFGLSGNLISMVTIFHSNLRKVSAHMYLAVLTAADSAFLLGILMVCLKVDFISFWHCAALEYVLMVSSYVSSWCTTALTIERYIAIAHPLKHIRLGHLNRKSMLVYWLPIPFILHLFQFINLVPDNDGLEDSRKCGLRFANYQVISESVDMLLCFGIPCLVVVVLNLMVAAKMNKRDFNPENRESRRQGGGPDQSAGLTRILFIVPLVFLVLNTPFYMLRMYEVFSLHVFGSSDTVEDYSDFGKKVYNTAHYLYYVNFACDVVVYAFSSANFRKTVVVAWTGLICPSLRRDKMGKYSECNTNASMFPSQQLKKTSHRSTDMSMRSTHASLIPREKVRAYSQKSAHEPRDVSQKDSRTGQKLSCDYISRTRPSSERIQRDINSAF